MPVKKGDAINLLASLAPTRILFNLLGLLGPSNAFPTVSNDSKPSAVSLLLFFCNNIRINFEKGSNHKWC